MMRRSCTLEGWHKTTIHLTRDGLRILAALTLAIVLVGANPSGSAQAAQAALASGTVNFYMTADQSNTSVCTKESITIRVSVHRTSSSRAGTGTNDRSISGVGVEVTNADRSMGTITPNRLVVRGDFTDPGVAEFTFTAGENAGTAYLYFKGTINNYWVGTGNVQSTAGPIVVAIPVQFEVRKCSYKVSVIFSETYPGVMAWTGWADEISLNAESANQYSGTTAFFYTQRILIQMPRCNFDISVLPTKINYQADRVENRLNLSITVQNTTNAVTSPCINAVGIGELGERQVDVSLPSGGGAITYPQPYGYFNIYVRRINDEGVANP